MKKEIINGLFRKRCQVAVRVQQCPWEVVLTSSTTATSSGRAPSPATVQVWVVPDAGHTQGLTTAPRAWEAHVIGFLDAALEP